MNIQDNKDLSIEDIVNIDAKRNHKGVPTSTVVYAFNKLRKTENVKLLRYGNSLLFVERPPNKPVEFHFVNAAPFDTFVQNVKKLLEKVKALGVTEMRTYFTNPRIIDAAKDTGLNYEVHKQNNDEYIMIVRL